MRGNNIGVARATPMLLIHPYYLYSWGIFQKLLNGLFQVINPLVGYELYVADGAKSLG